MTEVIEIQATQVKEWLETGEAILIDVRESQEFIEWHIPQATFMPLSNIDECLTLLKDEKRKIIFQCLRGMRGKKAAEKAMQLYPNVTFYNLTGGINAWKEAGFNIIYAPSSKKIPLNRQVFIAVGVFNILFSLAGLSLFTGLLGIGLIYAGLSGNCALAKLLSRMPWNK